MEGKVAAYGYESYLIVAAVNPIVNIDAKSGNNQSSGRDLPNKNASTFGNILKKEIEKSWSSENKLEGKPISYGSLGQIYTGIKMQKMYNETA